MIFRKDTSPGAHISYPLSSSALQDASLTPDFNYLDSDNARLFSAYLSRTNSFYTAAELSAIGLMGMVYHAVIQSYLISHPDAFFNLDDFLFNKMGQDDAFLSLSVSLDHFPTSASFNDPGNKNHFYLNKSGATSLRHRYYYSLILLLIAEKNNAITSRDGVFTDSILRSSNLFQMLLSVVRNFFSRQSSHFFQGTTLIDFLLEPVLFFPDSIFDQLQFISSHWSHLLGPDLYQLLLNRIDHFKEEFAHGPPGHSAEIDPLGSLDSPAPADPDLIRFSPDQDWMPGVVLQAKNIYVWLDQLSRFYHRSITRLDQIPESELLVLSRRGINGLWLIGLWERSPASQKIKQLCGNPEAVSSAYSLFDYTIAASLGGEEAYMTLLSSAAKYNIRLAADMVPNHMGIDSRWIIDHPDWFLSTDHPPFPSYSFSGPDLSSDPSISIHLEDHYYDKSDASIVFKRTNIHTSNSSYIYHGNDGTSMPWNDTAQLDFLNPEVRESVIQTILHVARKFPIIRFDAAMTLSKKHYQRLWFPQPGTGGAIPTRSDFSLSKDQFDEMMPNEFWREVVDRVSSEVPDTLLLAEAFWMMEGYFVRSLGMHRVYNSAFMHMLRDEDNSKYRDLLRKTLEYDPQILKRYVNFMNNPDEETALEQFGSGGKYFGVCLLLSTLPGLPMFGHGQIEGFSEKYGMEYKRSYYNESPDQSFIERHEKEIFPLLQKRHIFAEVDHFILYDLIDVDNSVVDDVFAFSNRNGAERALIVYHNKWGDTRGRITSSTQIKGKSVDFLSGLGFSLSDGDFLTFRDHITGLEYIRSLSDLSAHGLYLELGAYHYHAFVDFRIQIDTDGSYAALENHLQGSGTFDLLQCRKEIKFQPSVNKMIELFTFFAQFAPTLSIKNEEFSPDYLGDIFENSVHIADEFYSQLGTALTGYDNEAKAWLKGFSQHLRCLISLVTHSRHHNFSLDGSLLVPWVLLGPVYPSLGSSEIDFIASFYVKSLLGIPEHVSIDQAVLQHNLSFALSFSTLVADTPIDLLSYTDLWMNNPNCQDFINLHTYDNRTWFHKESMEALIDLTLLSSYIHTYSSSSLDFSINVDLLNKLAYLREVSFEALYKSGYHKEGFLASLNIQSRRS